MSQTCTLRPFSQQPSEQGAAHTVLAEVSRSASSLQVTFRLMGHLSKLVLPEPDASPNRQDSLWESTCFEFFLGLPNTSQYWETNISPSHHWNVYRFSGYREGMQPEARIQQLECQQTRSPSELSIQCQFPLDRLDITTETIELNLTTVLQQQTGDTSYWAVTHAPDEADFHHRPSFTLTI